MKYFDWSVKKNEVLRAERNVVFEDIVFSIMQGGLLDIIEHPDKKRYPNQRILVVEINDYAYVVPFVEDENSIFLKTIIPSRKLTKTYLNGRSQ